MKKQFEINGFYGSGKTPCTIYTIDCRRGTWYTVHGSVNVNLTHDEVHDGVNVEELVDIDTSTSRSPILSLGDLVCHVED